MAARVAPPPPIISAEAVLGAKERGVSVGKGVEMEEMAEMRQLKTAAVSRLVPTWVR